MHWKSLFFVLVIGGGSPPAFAQPRIDLEVLLRRVAVLASDSLQGRQTQTTGSRKAQALIATALAEAGVKPFGEGYAQPFRFVPWGKQDTVKGVNLVGWVKGTVLPDTFLVVSAHYDHLGVQGGQVYNGADDNASGTAAVLALADYFGQHPPRHSLLLVCFDAEEMGLRGARAFLEAFPMPLAQVRLNLNLDMVGRNDQNELYAVGTRHYPFLRPTLEAVAARSALHLRFGHDEPGTDAQDWTHASDHGVFHQAGVPFVYIGVEDHPDYHRPSDDVERLQPVFYHHAVETILDAVLAFDERFPAAAP
jgi:Zn-dependent M28 family amino/carboxypeptidase